MKHCVKKHLALLALALMPLGAWAQTNFSIQIGDWTYNEKTQHYQFVGKEVTSANASDVFGDGTVSYNNDNGVLTLNGATINGCIYSNDNLTINLIGDNFISATDSNAIVSTNFTQQLTLTLKGTGRLTMEGQPCISGFSPTLRDNLQYLFGSQYGFFDVIGTQLFSGGTGTIDDDIFIDTDADDPFMITSAGELKLLSKCINHGELTTKYFKLANDIDCDGMSGFEPIGSDAHPFEGFFNGTYKRISNLTYTTSDNQAKVGLFGKIGKPVDKTPWPTIWEIYLDGCVFEGGTHTGGIAGYLNYGTITNCSIFSSTIRSGNAGNVYVGGIVGTIESGDVKNSDINATNIYATTYSTETGGIARAGGLVGNMVGDYDWINGSKIYSDVTINSSHAGEQSVVAAGGLFGGVEGTGESREVTWNEVSGDLSINCESGKNNASVYAGAIAGEKGDVSLVGNYYMAVVTTSTKTGSSAAMVKSGYTQRGIGDGDDVLEEDGAVLKTKKLTLPSANTPYATYTPVAGTYLKIEGNDVYVASGQITQVVVTPKKNDYLPTTVTVTYTDWAGEKTITPTKANDSYTYSFLMPDFDAAFNVTFVDTTPKYNLYIGGIQVSEGNRNDILSDAVPGQKPASFIYNPQNHYLIINNMDEYEIESQITDLTIYFAPKSESKLSRIIYSGKGEATLTFTTDGNNPGRLILDNTHANMPSPVISGFSQLVLDEKQNISIISPENVTYQNSKLNVTSAIIGVPLNPITKDKVIVPDGSKIVAEGGDSDINKIVDDILYTLGDTDEPDGDGFDDGGFIVINTVTKDHEAAEAIEDYTPGTDDFMEHLKGMTFMVPAGNGKINLDVQTMDGHILKVKIGDAFPASFEKTERGDIEIPYNVGEPTYVYLYNGGPAAAGARGKAISKGGKKKVTHIKVYKTGVSTTKVNSSNPVGEASGGAYTGDTSDLEGQEVMSDEDIEAAMGDVDGDGKQTATDIVEMIKAIMGKHSGVYDDTNADMNGDGEVNISDIIQIVNKIK